MSNYDENNLIGQIAIIGMAGRFPGAKDMNEFWHNLYNGVESVKFFNREELIRMGIDEHLLDNPKFVAADAILDDMDKFDAAFFDYSAREAEIMDPQHRLFLESAWEVLESAGYSSELYDGRIGVYASANLSGYMIRNLYSNPGLVESIGTFKIMLANGQDFLATKASYKMNLMGPSVNVNTLCSSSMVALHYACQELQNYSCDIALAGGASFQVSRSDAFFYQEGGIGSSDGHCRAFDSKANGTVSGSGLGVVALKRLEDAIADGDYIHAVIRGTGINNDGSSKNSYTAPNVDGQAECISEAIAISGVDPETITYIDAHGTGTNLGDPIEIAALTKAFRASTRKKQFCAIGSVKTNIGHLVNAGGIASMFKTILAMKHRVIPPSLNFDEPNPNIDFINSPFYINTELSEWKTDGFPLRAGVSSFGIGGTNTHVILEEAPAIEPSEGSKRLFQLISLSAKTEAALENMTANLIEHVKKNPDLNIADMAYTLHVGRKNFNHRRTLVVKDVEDLIDISEKKEKGLIFSRFQTPKEQTVVFMIPGTLSYYENAGVELYNTEPSFKNTVDQAAEILERLTGFDIRRELFKRRENLSTEDLSSENSGSGSIELKENIREVSGFIISYALGKLLMEWDIIPQSIIAEGMGEYTAACLGGVMALEHAILLITSSIEDLPQKLDGVTFNTPKIPFISSLTGDFISDEKAQSGTYWLRQRQESSFEGDLFGDLDWEVDQLLRGKSSFEKGLLKLLEDTDSIFIDIGPKNRLAQRVREICQHNDHSVISIMTACEDSKSEAKSILVGIGQFWLNGGRVNWNKFYSMEKRNRIPLPTYPFERQSYWIEPGKRGFETDKADVFISKKDDITETIMDADLREGSITVSFKLYKESIHKQDNEENIKKFGEMLKLKQRLEEVSKEFQNILYNIEISPVGLKGESKSGNSVTQGLDKLKRLPRPEMETPYAPPQNEVEKIIEKICAEVLGYDRIGVNDDFFQLGGHSLLAVALIARLRKAFHKDITLQSLFDNTTIAKLAQIFGEEAEDKDEALYEKGVL